MDKLDPANYTMKPPRAAPQMAQGEAKVFIEGLGDDELRKMAREKLSELLQAMDAKTSPSLLLSVAREIMDRLDGKPTQAVKVDTTVKGAVLHLHNVELSAELLREQIGRMLKKPYVVIEQS